VGGPPAAGRARLEWAAAQGFEAVRLDGTEAGMRARDLDRSARRDLASLLRRLEVAFGGIDLWIPPAHFAQPAHVARALAAMLATLELCADLARLAEGARDATISIRWPDDGDPGALEEIRARAETVGVAVAMRLKPATALPAGFWLDVDPATMLASGAEPTSVASGDRIACARLTDARDEGRVTPGTGDADLIAYAAGLIAAGYSRRVVLDLSNVPLRPDSIERAVRAWAKATAIPGL
jgi:sugar phosphate isomerase/epimerase